MGSKFNYKRLNNRRFRKTEEAILEAFFVEKKILSIRVLTRRAKISRSTLYRHHENTYEVVPDYEEYILKKYCNLMRGLMRRKNIKLRTLYYQMLIFIFKNKNVLKVILLTGDKCLIEKMVQKLEPRIVEIYKLPKNHEKMLRIYRKEIAGLIEEWIENGMNCEEMDSVLMSIMDLTKTMRQRLRILLD